MGRVARKGVHHNCVLSLYPANGNGFPDSARHDDDQQTLPRLILMSVLYKLFRIIIRSFKILQVLSIISMLCIPILLLHSNAVVSIVRNINNRYIRLDSFHCSYSDFALFPMNSSSLCYICNAEEGLHCHGEHHIIPPVRRRHRRQ